MTFALLIKLLVGKTIMMVKMSAGEGLTITFTDGSVVDIGSEKGDSELTFNDEDVVYPHKPSNYDNSSNRTPPTPPRK